MGHALRPRSDNALLLVTGLSPGAHAASSAEDPSPGWWEEMVGPGQAIDTGKLLRRLRELARQLPRLDRARRPSTRGRGERYRLTFPVLTIEDIATAAHEAVRALGIERLRARRGAVPRRDDGARLRDPCSRTRSTTS